MHTKRTLGPLLRLAALATGLACVSTAASAAVTTYTSSTAFTSALGASPTVTEDYGTTTAGTVITPGTTLDGITYTAFTVGPSPGTPGNGFITSAYNSFTGKSLGAQQAGGAQFFFGGDTFTITFSTPVKAAGGFFNVNANSGSYFLATPVGTATTTSATYDISTFVFVGLISSTPFTTATFGSTDPNLGSFNIPKLLYAPTPEPSSLAAFGFTGLGALGLMLRARKRRGLPAA